MSFPVKNFTLETITNERGTLLIFRFVNVSEKQVFFPSWFISFHNQIKHWKITLYRKGNYYLQLTLCYAWKNIFVEAEATKTFHGVKSVGFVLSSLCFVESKNRANLSNSHFEMPSGEQGVRKSNYLCHIGENCKIIFFTTNRDIFKIRPWQYESLKNLVAWFTSHYIPANGFSF